MPFAETLLSYYGLGGRSRALDPESAAKEEDDCAREGVDTTDCLSELRRAALYGVEGDDKRRWVAMHLDIMRTSIADDVNGRISVIGRIIKLLPKGSPAYWGVVSVLAVVLVLGTLFLVIPMVFAVYSLFSAVGVTARVKVAVHGLLAFIVFVGAFVVSF